MKDARLILTLALEGDEEDCFMELGWSRARTCQRAIQLADDPQVALEHADLVQRVRVILEQGRARRDGSRIS